MLIDKFYQKILNNCEIFEQEKNNKMILLDFKWQKENIIEQIYKTNNINIPIDLVEKSILSIVEYRLDGNYINWNKYKIILNAIIDNNKSFFKKFEFQLKGNLKDIKKNYKIKRKKRKK